MKSLRNVLGLHFTTLIFFGLLFPLLIWIISLMFPNQAEGLPLYKNGKLIGYENIGQKFTNPSYFWGRPSAVDYNASATGGSNKGPTNPDYLKLVQDRIDTLLKYNPGIKKSEIPADMVTASGGGLDPHISPQGAYIQVARVASARNLNINKIKELVKNNIETPLFGLFGTERVNVLKLNLALESLTQTLSQREGFKKAPSFGAGFEDKR